MTVRTPDWQRTLDLETWYAAPGRMFIRITAPPKDAGTATLRLSSDMWNYLPQVERVIKVPPSLMLEPWMGSDFSNDDLVKESSLVDDYTHQIEGEQQVGGDSCYQLVATPKPGAPVVWGRLVVWVRTSDALPRREEYYDEHVALRKTLAFDDIRNAGDRSYPMRWTMTSVAKPNHESVLVFHSIVFDRAIPDRGTTFSYGTVVLTLLKAAGFLVSALVLGVRLAPRLFGVASRLRTRGVLLGLGLSLCFILSWLANAIGLAPIVGALAAGLLLEETHYREFVNRGERNLEDLIHPISSFLVPIFFVLMGMHTDLRSLIRPEVTGLGAALTVAAVVGKQACSLGVLGTGVDRLSVGIGMIPRGEVELIFANIGLALSVHGEPIIDRSTFSAVVMVVIVTTIVTPPALKWSFSRRR
jgi:outer membrane lipoprotein-sorting protein